MNMQQIIEKYLPMLQELQTKVALLGDARLDMTVRVENYCLLGDITVLNKPENTVADFCHVYFFADEVEKYLDEKIIELNAFFASKCITTATGVESPICLN